MKQFMENDAEYLDFVEKVWRKKVDLPIARPAGWHNPLRDRDSSSSGIPFYLKLDYQTKPQRIKDFLRNLLHMGH